MAELQPYLGVIADTDGVLTSTADMHRRAWQQMFDEFLSASHPQQRPFSDDDYLAHLDGKPRYVGVAHFLSSRSIRLPEGDPADGPEENTVCGLGNRKNVRFQKLVEDEGVAAFEGVESTLRRWRRGGLKIGIISASRNCRTILTGANLDATADVVVDGQDAATQGLDDKQAIMLHAARALGLEPSRCVVLEDATSGVEAARAAGFGLVVGITRNNTAASLREAGAHRTAPGLAPLRFLRELPSAFERWDELVALRERKPLAVFLDFDGTLAPIVDNPEQAGMSEATRAAVEQLAERHPVAIVSGRDRADVEGRVRLPRLIYAGNHGFDIAAGETHKTQPDAEAAIPAVDRARLSLEQQLSHLPGVIVERKRLSVGIHYRQVGDPQIVEQVKQVVEQVAKDGALRKRAGKKVFELEPDVEWDKGRALNWLIEALPTLREKGAFIVYVGDDETDEDAFARLDGRGIGIRVGAPVCDSLADYAVRDQDEVTSILRLLSKL